MKHGLEESVGIHLGVGQQTTTALQCIFLAENRILCNQIDGRVQLTDSERKNSLRLGVRKRLGKKTLE